MKIDDSDNWSSCGEGLDTERKKRVRGTVRRLGVLVDCVLGFGGMGE